MSQQARIIKKYANRRLYDTETSQSITLQDVRDLISRGVAIQVVEAKGGRDITRSVLLQIVADQELLGQPVLSDAFLAAIIRLNNNPLSSMACDFLERAVATVEQTPLAGSRAAQDLLSQWLGNWYSANPSDRQSAKKD